MHPCAAPHPTPQIQAHLNTLRRRLFTQIVQTLDADPTAPPPGAFAASVPAGPPPAQPPSRWTRVREKFVVSARGGWAGIHVGGQTGRTSLPRACLAQKPAFHVALHPPSPPPPFPPQSLFTSSSLPYAHPAAAAPGGAGGSAAPSAGLVGRGGVVCEARSRSREELAALLVDLHDDLMAQIHAEVHDFW